MSGESKQYSSINEMSQFAFDSSKLLFEKILTKEIKNPEAHQANIALQTNVKAVSQKTQVYKAAIMSAKAKAKFKTFDKDIESVMK